MQPRRRGPAPRRERGNPAPRHPTGNTRRRWPRAYDGGAPAGPRNDRYRRLHDGGERRVEGPALRRRNPSAMNRLRRHPVRHGLIGLTIAGSALPVAIARHNQSIRNAPSHEQIMDFVPTPKLTDTAVGQAWRDAQQGTADRAGSAREDVIQRNLQRYASYDVPRDLAESIYDLALETHIDPDVAFGLVRAESTFKNSATSHVGAIGLTQLMPATARIMRPGTTVEDLRQPDVNLRIGFKYLSELLDKYNGDAKLALTAYNRGPGTVDRVLKKGGDPDNGYAHMVMKDIPADNAAPAQLGD
ncbi:MAG: Lytic transglycosylase catalytic [Gemmatimonadetes bacterium]|nr:Lytic transglycosylase catalytic [Gemmatimonadota bacterium]